jgi:mannose-6-phosphate isomerase-like protein (cupin superfamily)
VTARLTRWDGDASPDRAAIERRFRDEGLSPHGWGNAPADRYGTHSHGYHKVLYCVSGGIVFHMADGDIELGPGDRLDVGPGTEHAATVGPAGVECLEASR